MAPRYRYEFMHSSTKISRRRSRKSERGVAIALVVGLIALLSGISLIPRALIHHRASVRAAADARTLITAHAFAALLKQDLYNNYIRYRDAQDGWPGNCNNAQDRTIQAFVDTLREPPETGCEDVLLKFPLVRSLGRSGVVNCSDELANDSCVPLNILMGTRLASTLPLNGYEVAARLMGLGGSGFVELVGEIELRRQDFRTVAVASSGDTSGLPILRTTRLIIDLVKLETYELNCNRQCKTCPNTPGALCCDDPPTYPITYLDGQGGFWDASVQGGALQQTPRQDITARPLVISSKIHPTPVFYAADSFCLPGVSRDASRWVVDAAIVDGKSLYLTTHGRLIDQDRQDLWDVPDPKMVSIADDGVSLVLLRSDGKLFRLAYLDVRSPHLKQEIPDMALARAEKLVMGSGPLGSCSTVGGP